MTYSDLNLHEAAALLRSGQVGAVELATALLDHAQAHASLNAFNVLSPDHVLAQARARDAARARGDALPPLHGVPIAIKDNIACAGLPMTANTPSLAGYVPRTDAAVVAALKAAGAVVFGKTGMHELAIGVTSNNAFGGAVRNAFDETRIAGGSSGGSGAAVGARIVPAAIGTDTGGSIRIPAAFNGVFGLRPSVGRWSQQGLLMLSQTRDSAGPIARTVRDLDLLDGVVTGRAAATPRDLRGLRLGRPLRPFWDRVAPDVARACERVLTALEGLGARIVDVDLEALARQVPQVSFALVMREIPGNLDAFLAQSGLALTRDALLARIASPDVRAFAALLREPGQALDAQRYAEVTGTLLPRLAAQVADVLARERLDALVYPTSPMTAPPVGDDDTTELLGERVPTFVTVTRNMDIGSTLGLPGVALPVGLDSRGLPVSLALDAPRGADDRLLAVALALEQVLPPLARPAG